MSQNIILVVFDNFGMQSLLVSVGKNQFIQHTSAKYSCSDKDSSLDSFKQSLDEILPAPAPRPRSVALVLPYTWIDSDGKINKTKNQLISSLCQKHEMKPIGFISSDEAILDHFNKEQGVPSGPVLVNIEPDKITACLTDMGIIKRRLSQTINSKDNLPQICENAITKIKIDFSITPKMFIWGDFSRQTVLDFNNHSWVNKDKQDIFLHFPDIVFFDQSQVLEIFLDTINSQLINQDTFSNQTDTDTTESDNLVNISTPTKVEASQLGFSNLPPLLDKNLTNPSEVELPTQPVTIAKTKPKFKISLLRFRPDSAWLYLIPVIAVFIPILFFIFFYKVDIDVFVTPLDLNITSQVNLDPQASQSLFNQNIIAVKAEDKTVVIQDEVRTTGAKTIGEKAQGKVAVFNKTNHKVNISSGQILKTDSGIGFEFQNDVEVEASAVDLDQGLISMGKTVTVVEAVDIGSQSNIVEGTNLLLDDFSEDSLIARVEESFAGGNSRQIQSVSENDRQTLEDKISQKVSQAITQNQPDQNNQYILPSTTRTKQGNIEFGREIGEEADLLSASLETIISYYSLLPSEGADIVKFVSDSSAFDHDIDRDHSGLKFDFVEIEDLHGNLSVTGKASPLIDLNNIRRQLVFKNNNHFINILKSNIPRAYDFNLRSNCPFGKLPILPALTQNINLIIKIEL